MTDHEICALVAQVMAQAEVDGASWTDRLDVALGDAGVEIAVAQPDGSDPTEIVRLADGRMVYDAGDCLRIAEADAETVYTVEVCGTYPGAVPWTVHENAVSAEEAERQIVKRLDRAHPDYAPHFVVVVGSR